MPTSDARIGFLTVAEVAALPHHAVLAWVTAPAYGIGAATPHAPAPVTVGEHGDVVVFDNGILRTELGRDGRLLSLVHVAKLVLACAVACGLEPILGRGR